MALTRAMEGGAGQMPGTLKLDELARMVGVAGEDTLPNEKLALWTGVEILGGVAGEAAGEEAPPYEERRSSRGGSFWDTDDCRLTPRTSALDRSR